MGQYCASQKEIWPNRLTVAHIDRQTDKLTLQYIYVVKLHKHIAIQIDRQKNGLQILSEDDFLTNLQESQTYRWANVRT